MTGDSQWEIGVGWITGLMVGIEFPPTNEISDGDVLFAMTLDLGILRVVILRWDLTN